MAAICGASPGSARRSRGVEQWDNSILCFQVISNQCISSQSSTAITDPDSNARLRPVVRNSGRLRRAGRERARQSPITSRASRLSERHPCGRLPASTPGRATGNATPLRTSHLSLLTSHLPKPPSSRCFYDDCIPGGHIALVAAIQHFDTAVLPQN